METSATIISPSISLPRANTSLSGINATTPYVPQDIADIHYTSLQINKYYLWVIFALGFPGNVFSIIIILRLKPRHRSALYVVLLALVDNTCLVCKILFITMTRFDVAIGSVGCGFLEFLGIFTGQLANWLLVAMTADRCLEITMPLKSRKLGKRHYASFLISISTVLVLLNVPYFFITEYTKSSLGDYNCALKDRFLSFANVLGWINVAVYALVPAVLLAMMSVLIFRALKKSMEFTKHLPCQLEQLRKREKTKRGMTIMIAVACIVFTILVTPRPLLQAILTQWKPEQDTRIEARVILIGQVFYVLSDSSHAVNFYLYFLANARFRRQFVLVICQLCCIACCCCKCQKCQRYRDTQKGTGRRSENTSYVWRTPGTFSDSG